MRVLIPGPLRSYTDGRRTVDVEGRTLREALEALDASFPGFRFRIIDEQDRIREHIKVFVNATQRTEIESGVQGDSEIQIICALSGG